ESHGIERLIDKVSVFTAASETFAGKNTNATIQDTIDRFRDIIPAAHEHGMSVRGYVSCAVRCPYEGDIPPTAVANVCQRLLALGINELDLGDTIGAATPATIEAVVVDVIETLEGRAVNSFGDPTLTLHLHDTFGRAASCIQTALELGVRSFDASTGGLGGCPYASTEDGRAPGNIALSTLVRALRDFGEDVAIDDAALASAEKLASELIS
ncbi:MAG: hydroxymethylglutaryl-CoA lyase, partial [Phycisphaerales bacterium]